MDQSGKENLDNKLDQEEEFVFRGQRPDEDVVMVIRQHPWILLRKAYIMIIGIFLIIAALTYFGASAISSWVVFIVLVFLILYGFYNWFLWWNGNVVLTNQRIIQSQQVGLFSRKIQEAELGKIQDVVSEVKGLTDSLLNIGSINLHTAASEKVFKIDYMFNPYEIQQKIVNSQNKISKKSEAGL